MVLLIGCASQDGVREHSSVAPAISTIPVNIVWVSSTQCRSLPFGCSLGGQQGGLDAQMAYLSARQREAESLIFWSGSTFACDGGANHKVALFLAQKASTLPLRFIAPSDADLKTSPQKLADLVGLSQKPWIVSNFTNKKKNPLLAPWVDLTVGAGQFRVFNFVWPSNPRKKATVIRGYEGNIKKLNKLLAATPPNRVNLVVLNSPDADWITQFENARSAHILVDGMGTTREVDGVKFLAGDRIRAAVRPFAQAAFVIRVRTEPLFHGFYNASVAADVRVGLEFGVLPSATELSSQKSAGLWETDGEVALLTAPD